MSVQNRWENAGKAWRHLDKKSTNVQRNIEHISKQLDHVRGAKTIVDWGPGGGFLSQYLVDQLKTVEKVDYVDIIDSHFDLVEKTLADVESVGHIFDLSNLPDIEPPDVLIAYSVIYHMPSLKAVSYVMKYWNDVLRPETILVRNFFGIDTDWERPPNTYTVRDNLLRGNLMTMKTFLSNLPDYDVVGESVHKKMSHETSPDHLDIKIVLRRNNGH